MIAEARVLLRLLRGQSRHGSHAERLQAFYAPQAERYDAFRERLLHGRRELLDALALQAGERLVELGGGTGRNLAFLGDGLHTLERVQLVDLCPAMLAQARGRAARWQNVDVVEADATDWRPDRPVDCVYFSYALTMIPDWRAAIDNAVAMLKPGGRLGVVDFYVSAVEPAPGFVRHAAPTRWFWPRWFGHHGVRLDVAHLDHLCARLPDHAVEERRGTVPYLPLLRVPHYRFIGRKAGAADGTR